MYNKAHNQDQNILFIQSVHVNIIKLVCLVHAESKTKDEVYLFIQSVHVNIFKLVCLVHAESKTKDEVYLFIQSVHVNIFKLVCLVHAESGTKDEGSSADWFSLSLRELNYPYLLLNHPRLFIFVLF